MKFKQCVQLIKGDYNALPSKRKNALITYICSDSFKVTFWMRIGNWLKSKGSFAAKVFLLPVELIYKHCQHIAGVWIPLGVTVGRAFFLTHTRGIVVSQGAVVGDDVWLFQGVSVAASYGKGDPVIGNNVIAFAGAKIIGNVKIGNNVVIGANAVVTKDVPEGSVVVGIPAKVINNNGKKINSMYKMTEEQK